MGKKKLIRCIKSKDERGRGKREEGKYLFGVRSIKKVEQQLFNPVSVTVGYRQIPCFLPSFLPSVLRNRATEWYIGPASAAFGKNSLGRTDSLLECRFFFLSLPLFLDYNVLPQRPHPRWLRGIQYKYTTCPKFNFVRGISLYSTRTSHPTRRPRCGYSAREFGKGGGRRRGYRIQRRKSFKP